MKILLVIHDFLPKHAAGAEIYAFHLARELARRHDVLVFCTEHRPGYTPYALNEREVDGVKVMEMTNNHGLESFEETYTNPHADEAFKRILSVFQPDVLHIQSLMYHSLNYLPIAKEAGLPIVHTLHDFWFQCEQGGTRLRPDGVLCHQIFPQICSACLHTRPTIAGRWTQVAYQMFLSFRWMSGINLASLAARMRGLISRGSTGPQPLKQHDGLKKKLIERNEFFLKQLRLVDRFLCPSAFIRAELIHFGVDPTRTVVSPYGMDLQPFGSIKREASDVVRFGFVGTLAPLKGAHILLEAFRQLDGASGGSLSVHGSLTLDPAYVKKLRRLAEGRNVSFKGPYKPEEAATIFSRIDALVVPSLWYENQPLAIQEAYLAGVPVLASNLGGMAQSVTDGQGGWLFEPGDVADLAAKLRAIVENPTQLNQQAASVPPVKSIEEDAASIERLYHSLLA